MPNDPVVEAAKRGANTVLRAQPDTDALLGHVMILARAMKLNGTTEERFAELCRRIFAAA